MKKLFIIFFVFFSFSSLLAQEPGSTIPPYPANYSLKAISDWAYGGANIASFTSDPELYFGSFDGQIAISAVNASAPMLIRLVLLDPSAGDAIPTPFVTPGHDSVDFVAKTITASSAALLDLPIYADNATAITGGLTAGDLYRTASGQLMIVYTPE